MVLSLALVLALIGSGAGLLVGIFAFSEVSDTLECPASTGSTLMSVSNVTSYDNLGTLGTAGDATYYESEVLVDFLASVAGRINEAVVQEGVSSSAMNGEINLDTVASDWWFLSADDVGSSTVSISLWVKGDLSGSAEYPILSNFAPSDETDGIYIYTDSGRMRVVVENDGYRNLDTRFRHVGPDSNSEPPDDGQWHLLTFSYDKSITSGLTNMEYCLDGTVDNISTSGTHEGCFSGNEDNSAIGEDCPSFPITDPDTGQCFQQGGTFKTWTGSDDPPNSVLIIGSDGDHNRGCSGGSCVVENTFTVDDLAIWNGHILSHSDIDDLWNSGSGASASSISPSEIVGYYSFDDTTANGVVTTTGSAGDGGTGSEQCQSAKDIAWSVIGIMPVALFFGLFTLFNFVIPKS